MTYLFLDTDNLIKVFEGPEEPKVDVKCYCVLACNCAAEAFENGANRDVVNGYENNCPNKYHEAISKVKRNAIPVGDQEQAKQIIVKAMNWNPHPDEHRIEPGVLYPVGDLKVRIEEINCNGANCADGCWGSNKGCEHPDKFAILETTTPEQEKKEESQDDPLEIALEKLDTLYVLDFNRNLITIEELQSATRKVLEEFAASITRKTV